MGVILLIAGIAAASMSFTPSLVLQYIFVASSLAVGIIGLLLSKNKDGSLMRSIYYSWIGFVLIGLSIALVIWGTSAIALINVLGFFLLILGMVEFVFVLQILNYESHIPWKIVGLKLTLSATTSIGAAAILTVAGFNGYMALLFMGLLFVTVGLTLIQISRVSTGTDSSVSY